MHYVYCPVAGKPFESREARTFLVIEGVGVREVTGEVNLWKDPKKWPNTDRSDDTKDTPVDIIRQDSHDFANIAEATTGRLNYWKKFK